MDAGLIVLAALIALLVTLLIYWRLTRSRDGVYIGGESARAIRQLHEQNKRR